LMSTALARSAGAVSSMCGVFVGDVIVLPLLV